VVEAGGSVLGGVGISGAPGGDADEACAKAGIEAVRDRIEF
ncbi:MAG: heme-binding protein, partial [Xanthobacteraceae bacterium]